ncbi:MAG: cupin domain-containing protein [Bacteroidota bacterium]
MAYYLNKEKDLSAQEVFPGIVGKLVHTPLTTIADFQITAGTILPEHQHPHEQTSSVLSGRFRFWIAGEERILEAGEVAVIPGNTPHRGEALTDCRIIDVFAPTREDYKLGQ